jgi:hypothetical protein
MAGPIDLVLDRLGPFKLRENGRDRWRACCPAHGGKNATALSIGVGAEDQVLLHCWSGCEVGEIAASLGLELVDLFLSKTQPGDGSGPIPRRRLLTSGQALALLKREMHVLVVVAGDIHSGKAVSDDDMARVLEAGARILELDSQVHA